MGDRSLHKNFDLLGQLSIQAESVVARELSNRWLIGDGMAFTEVTYENTPLSIDGDDWKIRPQIQSKRPPFACLAARLAALSKASSFVGRA